MKQVHDYSTLTSDTWYKAPKRRTFMLSSIDRYLGLVFMATTVIYGRLRGIMVMKKFMESLNNVSSRALIGKYNNSPQGKGLNRK